MNNNTMDMISVRALSALAVLMASTTAPVPALAQSSICANCAGNTLEEICAAGATEGTLVREATPNQEAEAERYVGAFEEMYGIDVQLTGGARRGGSLIPQRMLTEAQAGQDFISDSFQAQQWGVEILLEDRYVQDVDWVALGFPEEWLTVDEDGRGLRSQRYFRVIAYNSDKYSANEMPSTWEELADPKWAGKIAVDPTGSALSYLALESGMGMEDAKAWFDRLLEVAEPVPFAGTTTSIQAIATGQFDITTNATLHNVVEQTNAGLPVAYKYLDYTMTSDLSNFVVADSPRTNAAVCFSAWWSTLDGGSAVMKSIEGEASGNDDRLPDTPEDTVIIAPSSAGDLTAANDFATYVAERMGG